MILNTLFNTLKSYPVSFTTQQQTEIDGQIIESSDVEILKTNCLCYRGSIGQAFKSDQFKADVAATIVLKPTDYNVTIPQGAKATVEGFGTFSVMFVDDVAGQGLAIIIPCKEITNG